MVRAPDRRVVATTDLLVEGRHFRRDWSGAFDIGGKAAAQNLADVAAMGASPTALLVGLAVPGDLLVSWAEDLVRGLAAESARAGASVVGGDVSSADSVMLAITALGDLGGREPVTRAGAQADDRLAIAGRPGHSAAGLALLEAGLAGPPGPAGEFAGLVASHRRPQPPYACGPEASGVRLDIEAARLPADPALRSAAAALGADWLRWVLTGGEDHALAATFPPDTDLPGHWLAIGTAREGHGVTVDSQPADRLSGWQHFA